MKKILLNALVFQIGWFVCVLGGNGAALIYTSLALLFHHWFILARPRQWYAVVSVASVGLLLDASLVAADIMVFHDADFIGLPLWLACLWLLFATTFQYCLSWLRGYLWIAAVVAALFGPLSYWLGSQLTEASIASPLQTSIAIMAVAWALFFPAGIYLVNTVRFYR